MRHFIVDTDTGADDVWAVVEALRAVDIVKVEAITVLCGNLPLDLCVKNAMIAAQKAGTYLPPIYRGMGRPLMKEMKIYASNVHGEDGLGNMNLPMPDCPLQTKHAAQAIIELAQTWKGELEIVTCGPLTNLAMAYLLEPRLAQWVKKVWILGGSANGKGNMTEYAEYNVYVDPEAASIILASDLPMVWVPWDSFQAGGEITPEEAVQMEQCGHPTALFCIRCVKVLREYHKKAYGTDSFGVIDSAVMTAALYPEIIRESFEAVCQVDTTQGEKRGNFIAEPVQGEERKKHTEGLSQAEEQGQLTEGLSQAEERGQHTEGLSQAEEQGQLTEGLSQAEEQGQHTEGLSQAEEQGQLTEGLPQGEEQGQITAESAQKENSAAAHCTVVTQLDMESYKAHLFRLLGVYEQPVKG